MKLRTRLAVMFLIIAIVPMLLFYLLVLALSNYQARSFTKEYRLTEQVDPFSGNPIQIFNRTTKHSQEDTRNTLNNDPRLHSDLSYLDKASAELKSRYAYPIVRRGDIILYCGDSNKAVGEAICAQLPRFDMMKGNSQGSIYLDGESQHLIEQMDFIFPDGQEGNILAISNVDDLIPGVKPMIRGILILGATILVSVGIVLTYWVYRSVLSPLNKPQEATKRVRDGNPEFILDVSADDEIGQLCQDSGEMRIRLKENVGDKIQRDKGNKELISNISHDLKTPIAAIKGYVEGILDGAASSPERLDEYIRIVYNRSNGVDRLTDGLTFYSKIDASKTPYTFSKIGVVQYFWDCVEEVDLDMEVRGIELRYSNYVDEDVVIVADAEQMKRVINDIISNSIKCLDKRKGITNIRIEDADDFIQVETEDNGKGVAAKDLPNILDRFYRTGSSHNSVQEGSGIGLSIVRRTVEDYGERIRATSGGGIRIEIHFVLRRYQEVLQDEQGSNRGG